MPDRATLVATAFEGGLLLAGSVLLWRLRFSPAARSQPVPPALPRWEAPVSDFVLFVWLACAGGFVASFLAGLALKHAAPGADLIVIIGTAAGQLGVLTGIAVFESFFNRAAPLPPATTPSRNFFVSGLVTFVLAMPLVAATSLAWQALLEFAGMPVEKQDMIRMLLEAKSPLLLAVMIALACVGAPLAEELVFRRGLFRYARTRLPRWAALLVPACLFAALHQHLSTFAPLVVLGILFSLAYERTGRIGTSIVAHALFNLNSLVLVLAKVDV